MVECSGLLFTDMAEYQKKVCLNYSSKELQWLYGKDGENY